MGLLTHAEKQRLMNLLLQLPNINDPNVRELLVADLPTDLQNRITPAESPAIHIANIVNTIDSDAWAQHPDGAWSIILVIQAAIYMLQGSRLAQDLQSLVDTLTARAAH